MQVGTKSVLFGVHNFLFHPLTVLLAWIELYGIPNWKELVCIFIHDLGYCGKPNMDGKEGELHPGWAAQWAFEHLDGMPKGERPTPEFSFYQYYNLCLFHSRTCAKRYGVKPSKLCWADKLSCKYDPWWFYLLRAVLSGEIKEYHEAAIRSGLIPITSTYHEWFDWARERGIRVGYSKNTATAYEVENPNLF